MVAMRGNVVGAKASLLFDFSHSRQALLSVAQPALGAFIAHEGFPALRVVGLGLVASLAGMLCVYASNDLLDLRTDRQAVRLPDSPKIAEGYDVDVMSVRHPVALGVLSTRLAVAWVVGLGLVALVFAFLLRPGCAVIFVGCVCLEAVYCALKRRTWLKTIPGGAMVGLGGLAGWYAVRDLDLYALAFFFLLTFWEIFGRNLTNDLADLSHDAPLGIKTLAAVHGPKWSARVSFAGTVAILPVAALQQGGLPLRLLLAAAAAWTMTLPAFGLVRSPEEAAAQRVFNRASFFPPLAFLAVAVFFAVRWAL
ncbi:MAG: UbiA prenyltransferase family protein [bacterium]